ncbi:MFS transporter [Streptomyces sp. NPDC097981]|uniref:MFS transporter n=1 Tax=Streptomyces sp. NPDC097981 TaxID=3155428 RepID=UPI00332DCB3A
MSTAAPPRSEHTVAGRGQGLDRGQVRAVAACYFVASFAALGLPPYLTAILPGLGDRDGHWAGLLYVLPTVFSALGAPLWGRLADRFGRKRLLLRAQLGLSVSFLLAGAADSLPAFTAALVLQGFLGGTFAASNGYLAAALEGPRLSGALTLMQGSARASLVAAPILVGALSPWIDPHRQYLLMAALPLAAAALLARMPEPCRPVPGAAPAGHTPRERGDGPLRLLYALEFVFVFSTIVSFPYLIALIGQRLPGLSATVAGLLFALPHLCYLLLAARVHHPVVGRPRPGIGLGLAVVALGLAGHAAADSLAAFVVVRLVFGAGLTLGLVSLSVLAAEAAHGRAPGRMFGTVEFFSKSGAVAAGAVAALVAGRYGASATMLTGTAAALAAATALLLSRTRRRQ